MLRNSSMQQLVRRAAALFVAWLGAVPIAYGAGSAPVPVQRLIDGAGAIVIAKILNGTLAAPLSSLTLEIEDVLKGPLQAGAVAAVECRSGADAVRYTSRIANERGLFFLEDTTGKWSILPVESGAVPDLRRTFFVLPPGSQPKKVPQAVALSLHARILAEVAGGIESGEARRGGSVDFMWEYRSDPSPAMDALFTEFKASPNAHLRAVGLRASARRPNGLADVERTLGTQSASALANIAEEIRYYVTETDPGAVAQLGRLAAAKASPSELRRASLTALARIHTRECLPYLAEFLDDRDPALQALAVGGMAMFANNVPPGQHEPAAGPWKYRTEETLRNSAMDAAVIQSNPGTVTFWKSWWAERQAELQ